MSTDKIKTSRASQTRAKTVKKQVWTPPSSLDAPPAPDGYHHRWIRAESMGFDDTKNMSGKLRSGYELVRADQYPDVDYPAINDGKYKGVIGVGGLLLARISLELVKSREEYFNNLTKAKDEAINNDLMKEQHPGMPIDVDRQTRVTFGGTKKTNNFLVIFANEKYKPFTFGKHKEKNNMANQDAAFGLRPLGKIGQSADNNAATEYEVAACASAFAQNDCMVALAAGTVGIGANTDNGVLLGSMQGVFFTDATTSKPTFANHLVASNAATDIKAFVTDDPFQVYEIQSAATGATQQLDVFTNADLTVAAGVTPHFVSKTELTDTQSTTTANLRIIGVSDDPDNSDLSSANCNFKVIIAEHFYMTATGV